MRHPPDGNVDGAASDRDGSEKLAGLWVDMKMGRLTCRRSTATWWPRDQDLQVLVGLVFPAQREKPQEPTEHVGPGISGSAGHVQDRVRVLRLGLECPDGLAGGDGQQFNLAAAGLSPDLRPSPKGDPLA